MEILGPLILSSVFTYLLALGLLRWAPRLRIVDACGTPIGGAALVLGSLAGFLPFTSPSMGLWGWLIGALAVALVGTIDDRRGLSAEIKLIVQALAALCPLLLGGFIIRSLDLFGVGIKLGLLAVPFTLLWIVGVTNALNLIDGLDGLAAGLVVIVASAIAILSAGSSNGEALALSLALLGAALAFLRFNTHPARLFLGDGGSYFLGFVLSILTVAALGGGWGPAERIPFLIVVILLGYPVADTLWAIIRRVRAGRSIFTADREHIHHQLLKKGRGYRRTVWLLYGLFALLAGLGLLLGNLTR